MSFFPSRGRNPLSVNSACIIFLRVVSILRGRSSIMSGHCGTGFISFDAFSPTCSQALVPHSLLGGICSWPRALLMLSLITEPCQACGKHPALLKPCQSSVLSCPRSIFLEVPCIYFYSEVSPTPRAESEAGYSSSLLSYLPIFYGFLSPHY